MVLTEKQMEEKLEKAPRKNVGRVTFGCANCGRTLVRTIWSHASEIDEDGHLYYDFDEALGRCRCGAMNLVAFQPDGQEELYWLNKEEMLAVHQER